LDKAQNEVALKKFILTIFSKFVKEYESGVATKLTGKNLLSCSRFIEAMAVFNPLSQDLNQKSNCFCRNIRIK
jgi:hypothetical protein